MSLLNKTLELSGLYGIKPARSKGQNFLIEENIYDKIIAAADLKKNDFVLEVGPGLGFLTERLAQKAGKVAAVELDDRLAANLERRLADLKIKNVSVINENILDLKLENGKLAKAGKNKPAFSLKVNENYKIAANLPYNITSFFLRKFISGAEEKPVLSVLMLQREVAERICARPPEMSVLAVSVQFFFDPEIVARAPAGCFWPRPKVDSAVMKLKIKKPRKNFDADKFFRLVNIGFGARRKMLKNNLAKGLKIGMKEIENSVKTAGVNPAVRAETLTVRDWLKLFGAFGKNMI